MNKKVTVPLLLTALVATLVLLSVPGQANTLPTGYGYGYGYTYSTLGEVQEYHFPPLPEQLTSEQAIVILKEARASHEYFATSPEAVAEVNRVQTQMNSSYSLSIEKEQEWVKRYDLIIALLRREHGN